MDKLVRSLRARAEALRVGSASLHSEAAYYQSSKHPEFREVGSLLREVADEMVVAAKKIEKLLKDTQ